jgi:hypothetical protein
VPAGLRVDPGASLRGLGPGLGTATVTAASCAHSAGAPEAASAPAGPASASTSGGRLSAVKSSHIVDAAWGTHLCFGPLRFCLSSGRFSLPRFYLPIDLLAWGILASSVIALTADPEASGWLGRLCSRLVSTVWCGASSPSASSVGELSCYPGSDEGAEPSSWIQPPWAILINKSAFQKQISSVPGLWDGAGRRGPGAQATPDAGPAITPCPTGFRRPDSM